MDNFLGSGFLPHPPWFFLLKTFTGSLPQPPAFFWLSLALASNPTDSALSSLSELIGRYLHSVQCFISDSLSATTHSDFIATAWPQYRLMAKKFVNLISKFSLVITTATTETNDPQVSYM